MYRYYVFVDGNFKGTFNSSSASKHCDLFNGSKCEVYQLKRPFANCVPVFEIIDIAHRINGNIKKIAFNREYKLIDVVDLAKFYHLTWSRSYMGVSFHKKDSEVI